MSHKDLVHHHTIYQARVGNEKLKKASSEVFEEFLDELVSEIDMKVLIPPQTAFSEHEAWTGLIGIVTSHISFHYWTKEQYVQMDIYSCKSYDREKAINFMNKFWQSNEVKVLFVDRGKEEGFNISKQI